MADPDYGQVLEVLRDLPRLVREAREDDGLSRRALARLLGLSLATVGRLEAGVSDTYPVLTAALEWLRRRSVRTDPGGGAR